MKTWLRILRQDSFTLKPGGILNFKIPYEIPRREARFLPRSHFRRLRFRLKIPKIPAVGNLAESWESRRNLACFLLWASLSGNAPGFTLPSSIGHRSELAQG